MDLISTIGVLESSIGDSLSDPPRALGTGFMSHQLAEVGRSEDAS